MGQITGADGGGNLPPRMILALSWDSDDTDVTILRNDPDGVARPVRGAEPLHLDAGVTSWSGEDYEAPFYDQVTYLAMSGSTVLVSTTVSCNPPFYANDLGWYSNQSSPWLKHLTIPALSMQVDVANAESPVYAQTRSVQTVLNRRSPIVLADAKRKNPTTTIDIRTWSLPEAAKLRALLADNSILLLDVPGSDGWGMDHQWIAVGDVTEERLWQEWAPYPGRVFHLPVEYVDRPAGGGVYPLCSYWSEDNASNTYAQFDTHYATYAALSSCTVNAGGGGGGTSDPITGTVVATTSVTDNQGVYGTSTTTSSGGQAYTPSTTFSQTYSQTTLPTIAQFITFYASTDHSYSINGDVQYVQPDGGQWAMILRAVPGSSPSTTLGTILQEKDFDGGKTNVSANATWTPPSNGTYTICMVLDKVAGVGTSISTTTAYSPTSQGTLYCATAYTQGSSTTTVQPADLITIALTVPDLPQGFYTVVGAQEFTNDPTAGPVSVSVDVYGTTVPTDVVTLDTTGGSMGNPATGSVNGPTALTTRGNWYQPQDGPAQFGFRVFTNQQNLFSDATSPANPRVLTVLQGFVNA